MPSRLFAPLFFIAMIALLVGCSGDSDPTSPDDDDTQPGNTPPIPTVPNPTDQLPEVSESLVVETVPLGNFSPKMLAQSSVVDVLNDAAIALDFQLKPGYGRLVMDGEPCPPGNLQWATYGRENWSDCVLTTSPPLIEFLDTLDGSHYYGLNAASMWTVQDLNCRLAGADLVTVGSAMENGFIHDLRAAWRPGEYIALGFYDWGRTNNDFAWRSGEPMTYTGWSSGEPNNVGGEYFAIMATTGPVWNDYNGVTLVHGILESDGPLVAPIGGEIPSLLLGESVLQPGAHCEITQLPFLVRSVHWRKVFQKTLGAGTTYRQTHSYTKGTEETTGMSFGYSIGISTELGWGPVTTEISMEFHQDFSRDITVYEESQVTDEYECTAPDDKTVIFAVWHLVETYSICRGDGTPWSDDKYALDGDLPELVQGLDQEYLQTIFFDQ